MDQLCGLGGGGLLGGERRGSSMSFAATFTAGDAADWEATSPSSAHASVASAQEFTPGAPDVGGVSPLARPSPRHGSPGDRVGRIVCKELIEAAQKAPRPSTQTHPSTDTELRGEWSELEENYNFLPATVNSCNSVFKHVNVSVKRCILVVEIKRR